MEFNTIDEVKADLQKQREIKEIVSKAPKLNIGAPDPNAGKIQDISYSGGFGNVFEKGSNGTYQMRYENYLGATGNENRLGKEQSGWEQAFNGLVKNISKAGIYAVDATAGTLYGIGSAIQDRKLSSLWDNDLSNSLDNASKYLDRELPNYYTDEQKSKSILGKMGSVNFWTNDFANGMAFVAGAVLPSILTGGTSLVASSARAGAKIAMNVARKEGKTAIRSAIRGANIGNRTGEILNFGKFVAQSAVFESGMEARHNFHDSIDNWINTYVQENGEMPTTEETNKFIQSAETASNVLFGSNLALLSITNAAMFGKVMGLGKITMPGTNSLNKLIGIGVEQGEKGVLKSLTPTKIQKLLGNAYFVGRKPFSEGVIEEGLQGVMGKMAQDYTTSKYEGDTPYNFAQSLSDAMKQQYGTKEGWNEIGIGMLVGMLGGNVSGNFGIEGIIGKNSETFSKTVKGIQQKVENRNSYVDTFRNINRSNSMFNSSRERKEGLQETQLFQDVASNYSYIKANMPLKGMTDMTEDYNAVVDSLEITDEQLVESGLENADEYRSLMKSQFQTDFDSYKKVNSFINNLDLSTVKLSDGNVIELGDALTMSLMMGEKADEQSKRLASNIESLTGVSGAYSALKFFENLDAKQLSSIEKLRTQQDNLSKLENELVKVQNSISEQKATGENKERITQLSKKYAVVSGQINDLSTSIESIKDTLDNEFKSIKSSDLTINTDFSNVSDVLDTVNNVRNLVSGLKKVGRTQDAKRLEGYLEQFSVFSQTALDSKRVSDSLLSTNFFKSTKGKKLISSIIGDEYKSSPNAVDSIKEIEEDIINQASNFGYSVADTEEFLKQLENSESLSDREKFRVEGIARVLATQKVIQRRVEEAQDRFETGVEEKLLVVDENQIEEITVESPNIVGDTVRTSSALRNINPTNSEQLKALVDEIASLTDHIVNKPTSQQLSELGRKRKQLEDLNRELELVQNSINNLNLELNTFQGQHSEEISMDERPKVNGEIREGNVQGEEVTQESQEEEVSNLERKRLEELENLEKTSGYIDRYKEPQTEFKIKKEYTLDSIIDELVTNNKILSKDGSYILGTREAISQRVGSFIKKIGLSDVVKSVTGVEYVDTSKLKREEAKKYYLDVLNKLKPFLKNVSIYEIEDSMANVLKGRGRAFADNESVYLGETDGKSLQVLVHELLHTLTVRGLDPNYTTLYDESFSKEISEIYKLAKDNIKQEYGLRDEYELIAEAFSNPVFMAKLASIKTQKSDGKSSNLFSDLIESIRNFLNSFLKIDSTSNLLENITNSVSTYLEEKENVFSKETISLEEYIGEVTKINTRYNIELEQLQQEEKISDELVDDILQNPEQTDKDFAIRMLTDAIGYESSNEFGNPESAKEYTEVLKRLENGEIDINEIGSVLNRSTIGENQLPTGTTAEGVPTENANTIQVSQTYEDFVRQEEERINSIEQKIESVSREIVDLERPFKFSETSEYKEFSKLLNISEDQRTDDQQLRLNELRVDINDWIMIMGTETQGVNFADIVEQMVALDNVDTYTIPDTVEVTPEEIEENFTTFNLANRQNLRVGLNFNAVTSTIKKDGDGVTYTEISNMSITGLEDASGVLLEGEDGVTMNPTTNAIQLNDVMVNRINNAGKIYINTFDEGLSTYYTPVRQATLSLSGDVSYTILRTDFYEEYAPEEIDDSTIYEMKSGQEVFVTVDPLDPYNKGLLREVSRELGVMSEQEITTVVEEELKLYKTTQLTKAQGKLRDLQNATKKDSKKIKYQEDLIQELLDSQRERLRKKLTGKRKTKLSESTSNEVRSKLKLMLVNKDGENLNVLKGSRDVKDIEKLDATKLQAVRDIFANDIDLLTKMIETPSLDITPVGLKVDRVLPGFPNYYATVSENGVLSRQSKTITSVEISKIHDVGYLEKGKILTRFGIMDVDTTFLSRQMTNKTDGRIPLVIIKKGNQNIAYPISIVSEIPLVTGDEMRAIKNSEFSEVEKAIKLNELLAKAGINTQAEGNAFIVVSGESINTEFFEDKVAQVESITYLRNVEDFLDERISKEDLLVGNASININLSEPFISPKLRLDFSNVVVKEVSNENLREKSKKTVSGVMSQLALDRQKICK